MTETGEVRWLDDTQQHSWRALMMGMTLLTERLDDDLRREFSMSLTEYEVLVRLSERLVELCLGDVARPERLQLEHEPADTYDFVSELTLSPPVRKARRWTTFGFPP